MGANTELRDRTVAHEVWMQRLYRQKSEDMLELLRKTEEDIYNRIVGTSPGTFKRRRLEQMLKTVTGMLHDGYKEVRAGVYRSMSEVADVERRWLNENIGDVVPVDISTRQPTLTQVAAAVRDSPLNGVPIKTWFQDVERGIRRNIEQTIRSEWMQGRTPVQIARTIRGTRARNYRDGVLPQQAGRRIDALVRTALAHSQNIARELTYEANDDLIKGVQIVATLDNRTSLICMNYDGRVFEPGEGERPPFHPNCRTTTVPVLKSWKELGIDLDEAPEGTRASMDGQVPAATRFPQWLEQQPAERQIEVLGRARWEAWKDGKVTLGQLSVRSDVPTLAELGIDRGESTPDTKTTAAQPYSEVDYTDPVEIDGHQFRDKIKPEYLEYDDDLGGKDPDGMYALKEYRGSLYKSMNALLRGQETEFIDPETARQLIDKMGALYDKQLTKTLPQAVVCYRGMSRRAADALKESLVPGGVIRDAGFVSTSYNDEIAEIFAGDTGVVLKGTAPKGTQYLPGTTIEHEVILERGTSFVVEKTNIDGSRIIAEGYWIPQKKGG